MALIVLLFAMRSALSYLPARNYTELLRITMNAQEFLGSLKNNEALLGITKYYQESPGITRTY